MGAQGEEIPPSSRFADSRSPRPPPPSSLSFLSDDQSGFSLPYPLLALHAVSSSVPSPLASSSTTQGIYCQIDDAAGADGEQDGGVNEDDEDEGSGFRELWIVPASSEDGEARLRHRSTCTILLTHPSPPSRLQWNHSSRPYRTAHPSTLPFRTQTVKMPAATHSQEWGHSGRAKPYTMRRNLTMQTSTQMALMDSARLAG